VLREDSDEIPEKLLLGKLNPLIQLSVLSRRSPDDELKEPVVGDRAKWSGGLRGKYP
jgi:hypothetical protein